MPVMCCLPGHASDVALAWAQPHSRDVPPQSQSRRPRSASRPKPGSESHSAALAPGAGKGNGERCVGPLGSSRSLASPLALFPSAPTGWSGGTGTRRACASRSAAPRASCRLRLRRAARETGQSGDMSRMTRIGRPSVAVDTDGMVLRGRCRTRKPQWCRPRGGPGGAPPPGCPIGFCAAASVEPPSESLPWQDSSGPDSESESALVRLGYRLSAGPIGVAACYSG